MLSAEIVRLRQQNKKLCEALAVLKGQIVAGSISPRDFVAYVDKRLEGCGEE
jgi:hypothetical protein